MATNHTPLSEADFQSFWITWVSNTTQNGLTIRAGIGGVRRVNEFLFLHDSDPCIINYIGISTGEESEGTWIFSVGKFICVNICYIRVYAVYLCFYSALSYSFSRVLDSLYHGVF